MYFHKDDLMYEQENLRETIRYLRTHNGFLRDRSEEEVDVEFWKRILETIGSFRTARLIPHEGHMEPIFNAWFLIDPARKDDTPGSHAINFFVRMGRKPALGAVE